MVQRAAAERRLDSTPGEMGSEGGDSTLVPEKYSRMIENYGGLILGDIDAREC